MAGVQSLWTGAVAEGRTGDKKLQLLTLTFDASRDTPADFKAYGNQFGVDFDLWTLATGPDELLNDAIPSLFGVLALPLSNGEITHSVKVGLLKPGLEMVAEWPDNAFLPGEVVEHVLQP